MAGIHGDPRGLPVPSECRKQFGHRFERLEQMEHANAAARAVRHAIVEPQNEHRPVIAFDYAAGDDPHHATMPALAREHQRGVAVGDRLRQALFENRLPDAVLRVAPVFVQLVKLRGDRARPRRIAGGE